MAQKPGIMNVGNAAMVDWGKGGGFAAKLGRLGPGIGLKQLGCTLVELEPGKRAWPYHLHCQQDEMFVILEGEGTLRYDGETYPLRAGDMIGTPAGLGTAHQIINTSTAPLRYLAISSMSDVEIAYYPDSDKYGAYARRQDPEPVRMLFRKSSSVDYWDGEV